MNIKHICVITLILLISGCVSNEDITNNIQISDSKATLPTSAEENGKIVAHGDNHAIKIREWAIEGQNITCWSYTEINSLGMQYSGFSCTPNDQL